MKSTSAIAPKTGRLKGAAGRTLGSGIKILGLAGSLGTLEELRSAFAGLGPQVDLEGLDPGDFEVGHKITGIDLGDGWTADVTVARNIIGRRKFYVTRVLMPPA